MYAVVQRRSASFTHHCTVDNLGSPLLFISAHLRQPCSSVLTCRHHNGLINWHRCPVFRGEYEKRPDIVLLKKKKKTTYTEPRQKEDVHTSTMIRAALTSSSALCQKKKKELDCLSKCNSAILLWPLPCFVLALITVEEHMVRKPEVGFTDK